MPEVQSSIEPEKILRDLRDLWAQLAKDQETAGGVIRACAMTLIAIAEDDPDAEKVRQTLGVLMHDHPSRAIVLRANEGAEMEARVFAECWMPFGRDQQICAEGIEITADAANLGDLAQLLLPLIVPDLPVVLWCRGPRFFSTRYFDPLFPLAGKIIADSAVAPNARGAIAVLKELKSRGRRVADLTWTRLTGWREALAHLLDDHIIELEQIKQVKIRCGSGPSTCELYFSRWIERSLPRTQVTVDHGTGPAGLRAITLIGEGREVTLKASDVGALDVCSGGRTARSLMPDAHADTLMRDELSIVGPDPAFDAVLT
jgi:glucose-6-phosphate dehydrogenase assembly protein OpcA